MADEKLMVDTSILIDYFRKTDKQNAKLLEHFKNYKTLYISSITEFEIINGAKPLHFDFWNKMLERFKVLDFDSNAARHAAIITAELKTKRKSIDKPGLFIAATALANKMTFDTLNIKHFIHIDHLDLLTK